MGLFSKTSLCAKCGAQFETGKLFGQKICPACQQEEIKEKALAMGPQIYAEGFSQYYKDLPRKFRSQRPDIAAAVRDRDRIIAKYAVPNPLSDDEFARAGADYESMSRQECETFAQRLDRSLMYTIGFNTWRDNYKNGGGGFVLSHLYQGLMIDFSDVFAVAYKPDNGHDYHSMGLSVLNDQVYTVALFTNDPYVPGYAIPIIVGKTGKFLSLKSESKSKEEALVGMLSTMFPALTCPIMKTKDFKKQLKSGAAVNCNISRDLLLALAEQADDQQGVFTGWFIRDEGLCPSMEVLMEKNGYMSDNSVKATFGDLLDRDAVKFWRPYFDAYRTLSNSDIL